MYIYIHIPFCNHICSYCDFPKVLYDKKYINDYLDNLAKEINNRYKYELVKTIYIGGGTPTSLDYDELEKLLKIITIFNKEKTIEYTIESNIESLDDKKITLLKQYGINRISLGVQSFNNENLIDMGRKHTGIDAINIINKLKKTFTNISIDLIYGINNNIDIVKKDIDTFLSLDIPHISCYSLIIEDNTIYSINKREYIDDSIEYKMYNYIEYTLKNNSYNHYEVSNYSKEGYESIHNLNYWNNGDYYGFGLGAVSYINNHRITNTKNLSNYIKGKYLKDDIYENKKIRISNSLILGLRKTNGLNIDKFNKKYKVNILNLYNIKDLIKENKLLINNNRLYINPRYFYLSNDILINFI
ncbi:MAG: radical SAM family heme chaperone HemW [Bacilli bacterium]|nr:radical SAM family heme chaperone HemW [Bacilli bacterium]